MHQKWIKISNAKELGFHRWPVFKRETHKTVGTCQYKGFTSRTGTLCFQSQGIFQRKIFVQISRSQMSSVGFFPNHFFNRFSLGTKNFKFSINFSRRSSFRNFLLLSLSCWISLETHTTSVLTVSWQEMFGLQLFLADVMVFLESCFFVTLCWLWDPHNCVQSAGWQ